MSLNTDEQPTGYICIHHPDSVLRVKCEGPLKSSPQCLGPTKHYSYSFFLF